MASSKLVSSKRTSEDIWNDILAGKSFKTEPKQTNSLMTLEDFLFQAQSEPKYRYPSSQMDNHDQASCKNKNPSFEMVHQDQASCKNRNPSFETNVKGQASCKNKNPSFEMNHQDQISCKNRNPSFEMNVQGEGKCKNKNPSFEMNVQGQESCDMKDFGQGSCEMKVQDSEIVKLEPQRLSSVGNGVFGLNLSPFVSGELSGPETCKKRKADMVAEQRRMIKNRESAARSRERKQYYAGKGISETNVKGQASCKNKNPSFEMNVQGEGKCKNKNPSFEMNVQGHGSCDMKDFGQGSCEMKVQDSEIVKLEPQRLSSVGNGVFGLNLSPFASGELSGPETSKKRKADTVAEQRQRRMIKNRESAARSRERKQAYQVELETLAVKLEEENEKLIKEKEAHTKERLKQLMERVVPVIEKQRPPCFLRRNRSMQW